MAVREIYILQKQYIDHGFISYERYPICGSENYDTIVNYAKSCRDYIQEYGDAWLSTADDEPLFAWNCLNYYAVGTNDRSMRIVFRISTIPMLKNDILKKE